VSLGGSHADRVSHAQHTAAPWQNSTHLIWSLTPVQAQHTPNLAALVIDAGGQFTKCEHEVIIRIPRHFTYWHLTPILTKTLWLCVALNLAIGAWRWLNI